jgi:hypothetical protein
VRGLAEFAMRGRLQALLIAVAGAGSLLFCWVSAAVIALVTLRKGVASGAWLYVWAILPAGTVMYVMGDSGPLTLLTATFFLAVVLRNSVSLPLTLLVSIGAGLATGMLLLAFSGQYLDEIVVNFGEFMAGMEKQLSEGTEPVVLNKPTALQIAGVLGAGTAMMSVLSLLLARYWQAQLYNPGGCGEEFRSLRYPPSTSVLLVVVALGLSSLGLHYRIWGMIIFIPLTFAGLALVHARVHYRGQGGGWLAWFYVLWIIFDPVKLVVVFFAIADSWMNFRERWAPAAVKPPIEQRGSDEESGDRGSDEDQDRDI